MMAKDFVDELSHLKAILVLEENVDMARFNQLYNTAIDQMIRGERVNKEMMEELFYFRNLINH
ncbi:hypothetical protein ACWN6Y_06615 [Vagococcus teuberi]|uniref:Uncharacterized protein n=1 Tax=Vagococcus teuberi TaxID=519472 RepID=A0A1J0A5K4_9ENTE|nr:hypothetical protein [Vagococcus teuberi]APB31208.1 hypothetical protein BHY08_04815 [Vagococcus teuberi]